MKTLFLAFSLAINAALAVAIFLMYGHHLDEIFLADIAAQQAGAGRLSAELNLQDALLEIKHLEQLLDNHTAGGAESFPVPGTNPQEHVSR